MLSFLQHEVHSVLGARTHNARLKVQTNNPEPLTSKSRNLHGTPDAFLIAASKPKTLIGT